MTRPGERWETWLAAHTGLLTAAIVLAGLYWRLHQAASFYVNPDEVLSYMVASQQDWHGWWGFYQNAVKVAHPPLFILILHGILHFGRSELMLRSVSILAGSLFPWLVMLWVRRMAGNAAGLSTLLLLTFSPALIGLSIEARTYALAFLFVSASLVALQHALDRGSVLWMVWFHLCLYLAILTDYSIVWFVGAAGVYGLLCLWSRPAGRDVRVAWTVGQAGAVSLYLFLLATAALRSHYVVSQDWLRSGFPQAGDHLAIFALKGSLRQVKYFVGSTYLVPFAGAAFLLGVYALWKKRSTLQIVLLILPFCLACAGAMLGVFPYGLSRHTAFLGILIAAGVAQGVSTLTGARILPVLMAAVFLIPIWIATAPEDNMAVPESRHRIQWMRDAVQFLRSNVAPGSVVVTDRGTELMLAYYLGSSDYDETLTIPFRVRESGGLRIISVPSFQFRDDMEQRETVAQAERVFRLEGPVWVAAGGFELLVKTPPSAVQPFSHAITIFRSSPEQP